MRIPWPDRNPAVETDLRPLGSIDNVELERGHARASSRWKLVLLRGIAGVLFGFVALLLPGPTLASIVLLTSVYLLVDGGAAVFSGLRAARHHAPWGWFVLEGATRIAIGAVALAWPAITVVAFVWLVALWSLVSGAFMLAAAFRWRADNGRGWLLLGGFLSLAWSVLLMAAPVAGAIAMTVWLGAYALVFGITLVLLAVRLRRESPFA